MSFEICFNNQILCNVKTYLPQKKVLADYIFTPVADVGYHLPLNIWGWEGFAK